MLRAQFMVGIGLLAWAGTAHLPAEEVVFHDSFDTGNSAGSAPAGWMVNAAPGSGDQVLVVDQATIAPASPPFCVELVDGSGADKKSNPFFNHRFRPLASGRITCRIQIPAQKQAPATIELLARNGNRSEPLSRLTFESNGKLSFSANPADSAGGPTSSSVSWMAGRWQQIEMAWTEDRKITVTADGHTLVEGETMPGASLPSELKIRCGGASISGQIVYADDIVVEETAH